MGQRGFFLYLGDDYLIIRPPVMARNYYSN